MSVAAIRGLLAEFNDPGQLLDAVARSRRDGNYSAIEAYSPYSVPGLDEAFGLPRDRIAPAMLLGAGLGGAGTYALEWYSAVVDYPLNVGGRPFFSWPAFVPAALEMTLLGAALFGFIALLRASSLPRVVHPLFDVPAFDRASSDRFFLLLRADDPRFEPKTAHEFLATLAPLSVSEVAA